MPPRPDHVPEGRLEQALLDDTLITKSIIEEEFGTRIDDFSIEYITRRRDSIRITLNLIIGDEIIPTGRNYNY